MKIGDKGYLRPLILQHSEATKAPSHYEFILDRSTSMLKYYDELKRKVIEVAKHLQKTDPDAAITIVPFSTDKV